MNDVPTEAIEHRDQIVKRAARIDVRDVDMPVLVRFERLLETTSLGGGSGAAPIEPSGILQDSINRGWTHRHDIFIEHHEAQSAVSFERMLVVEFNDRLLFPVLKPPVARNFPVVTVGFAVAMLPCVVLASREADPPQQRTDMNFGPLIPVPDVVNDLVTCIVGNPATFQGSPLSFFALMFSSINSAITSFLAASFSRSWLSFLS